MRKQIEAVCEEDKIVEDFELGMHRLRFLSGKYYYSTNGGDTWKEVNKKEYLNLYDRLQNKLKVFAKA